MASSSRQKCRLLLEGREVPFISATLVATQGSPISAMIDVVPLQIIKDIKPRTQVHIFVRDDLAFGNTDYYLAFEGEVVGRSLGKNASGNRYYQLLATDYSQYWDETKSFVYNASLDAGKVGTDIAAGIPPATAQGKFQAAALVSSLATVNNVMINKLLDASTGGDLVAGVVKIIQDMSQLTLYYSAAFERLRIAERVILRSSGNVANFLRGVSGQEFYTGFMGANGGLASLRTILNGILGVVYHDFISVPFPGYINVGNSFAKTIGNFLFVPDGYSLPPPKCNTIFPNQIQELKFSDDFRHSPTRFMYRFDVPVQVQSTGLQTMAAQYYPPDLAAYMKGETPIVDKSNPTSLKASTIFSAPNGKNYSEVNYGDRGTEAVGKVAIGVKLREGDFLTNEEALRGIFPETETYPPAITSFMEATDVPTRERFFSAIGKYMFFKKRTAPRQGTAQLLFHPFLVPGFSALFVDDSDALQSMVVKLQVVTHQLSNEGCATSVAWGYGRDFDEVDIITGGAGDPPLPPWFDPNVFGREDVNGTGFKDETIYLNSLKMLSKDEIEKRDKIKTASLFPNLSVFYQTVLGVDSVTDFGTSTNDVKKLGQSKILTSRGAATFLSSRYRSVSLNPEGRDIFVRSYIKRPIPTMKQAMAFVRAEPPGGIIPDEFAFFKGVGIPTKLAFRYDGTGYADATVLKLRRKVVDEYVKALRERRGFRG